jgi:hypothetical protein
VGVGEARRRVLREAPLDGATSSGGRSGRSAARSGGGAVSCWAMIAVVAPSNGTRPASTVNAVTPSE